MAKLSFSPQARNYLDEAADYLQNVLHNPTAAQKLVQRVKKPDCHAPGLPGNGSGS